MIALLFNLFIYASKADSCYAVANLLLAEITLKDYHDHYRLVSYKKNIYYISSSKAQAKNVKKDTLHHFALSLGEILSALAGSYSNQQFFNRAIAPDDHDFWVIQDLHERFAATYAPYWRRVDLFALYYFLIEYFLDNNRSAFVELSNLLERRGVVNQAEINNFFRDHPLDGHLPAHWTIDKLYSFFVRTNEIFYPSFSNLLKNENVHNIMDLKKLEEFKDCPWPGEIQLFLQKNPWLYHL